MLPSERDRWLTEPHVEPTVTVVLHGALAKRFGRRHELGVTTAAEAAHALCALHPDFREAFQGHHYRVIRGSVNKGMPLSENMLNMKIGRAGEIHFVAVARGSKQGGTGKIILGAIIVIVAVILAIPSGGTSIGALAAGLGSVGITAGGLAFFGASLILAGVSQLISPQPNNKGMSQADPRTSFGLSGQTNSVEQGSTIPVVYGRQRVGSVVVSFGYSIEDYAGTYGGDHAQLGVGIAGIPFPTTGAIGAGGGGKGGGGGASSGASEAPNTLRSNAIVRIIDALSEGPIGGLVDGAKSIFFNNTPLQAADGTYNFQGVSWEVRLGYPDQDPVSGYPAAEQVYAGDVGLPQLIKKLAPKTVTINSTTATAVRVVVRLPQLVSQNPKTGNLEAGPNLSYCIEVQQVGGNWQTAVLDNIVGQKCVSPYQRAFRFNLPGSTDAIRATSWNIRMTRLSPDDTTVNVHSEIYFDALSLITDHRLTYSNTAYIALTIDAAAFGSQIPTRQYLIDGIVCQVPLNYDAAGHSYATTGPGTSMGTWDGASWKPAVTSNPAWCLYDMFQNNRYGMALPARVLTATRYDLFPISQYCDGRVPSGFKDAQGVDILELRYACNVIMATQDDAYRVIQSMVSSFRGMSYWGAGRVVVTADMPCEPSAIMNQANVIGGEFVYEGTPLKSRHTVARVAWQDPANSFTTTIEVVEDFDAVVSLGQVPTDVHGFGVTSRGLARRLGKWLLETEKHQNETVSCQTGMEHLRVRPGDVTYVSDPAFIGYATGGRARAGATQTAVRLDREIKYTPEYVYTLSVTLPDATVETRTVSALAVDASGFSTAQLAAPLSQTPDPNASWSMQSTGPTGPHGPDGLIAVSSRQFRILSIAEPQRGTFSVVGINHDPNKYARVEYGLQFDPQPYSALGALLATPLPAPTNVFARDYIAGVGTTTLVRTTVSCTPASDARIVGQQFRCVGPESKIIASTGSTVDFDDLQLGTYVFGARSTGRDGRTSVWVDSPSIVVDGLADPPDTIQGLTAQGGAMQVNLSWTRGASRDVLHYEVWRAPAPGNGNHPFQFGGYTPVGTPASNGATLLATVDGTSYHDSGDVLGPDKAWAYWVRAMNTTLVAGAYVGPVKALTTYYLTDNLEEAIRNTASFATSLLGGVPTIAANLLTPGTHEKQLLFNSTDKKLYTWDSTHQVWVLFIPVIPDSTGKLTADQIGAINQSSISGTLTAEQTQQLLAGIQAGTITSDKIASLTGSKVTGTLSNATVVAGNVYDLDPVTQQLVVGVNASRLLGTLGGDKVTGLLPNALIKGTTIVDTDPVTGQVIAGVSAARLLGQLDGTKLSTVPASLIRDIDPLTNQQVVGLRAARIAGQVVASQIGAAAITAEQLAVGSPDNVLPNSCFTVSTEGWFVGGTATIVLGSGYEPNYAPTSDGAALISTPILGPGGVFTDTYYIGASLNAFAYGAPIPCQPNECWEAQVAVLPQAGSVEVFLAFARNDGTLASAPSSGPQLLTPPADGRALSSWTVVGKHGVAPAGTVAVTILIRLTNTSSSPAAAAAFLTRAQLGRTVPNATGLLPWSPGGITSISGGLIRSNSVTARTISANTITGDKMVANAITTRELSVGGGANVIWNASPLIGGDGWGGKGYGVAVNATALANAVWALPDGNGTFAASLAAGAQVDAAWTPESVAGQSVVPGEWWEAQCLLLPLYATGQVLLQWLKSDGSSAGVTTSQNAATDYTTSQPNSGQQQALAVYKQVWAIGQAPVLATSVRLVLRLLNATGSTRTATMFFSRASLGLTVPGALSPAPFAPGGLTTVGAGVIKTDAVLARNIAAGQITADKAAFGTSANVIWNSCCSGATDGWTTSGSSGATSLSFANDGSVYRLQSFGSGVLQTDPGSTAQARWSPQAGAEGIACVPGQVWEAQARLYALGAAATIRIDWISASNAVLSSTTGTTAPATALSAATTLDKYTLVTAIGTAPASAVAAALTISLATGQAYSQVVFTQALLAQTVPNATQASIWSPGGVTQISGGAIRTNSLEARTIKANQIGARELAIGSSANLITNSCCAITSEGWTATTAGGASAVLGSCASKRVEYATADGCGVVDTALPVGSRVDVTWVAQTCQAGETYEAQILVLPVASVATLVVSFVDAAGASLGTAVVAGPIAAQTEPSLALRGTLAPFQALQGIITAPAGAVKVLLTLRLASPQSSMAVGYAVFTRAGLGRTVTGATQVSVWAPGGVTSIGGGVIRTESIATRNLAAGAATIEKLAVASAANTIWNSCCSSSSAGWQNYGSVATTLGSVTGDNVAPASFALAGLGSGAINCASLTPGQAIFAVYDPDSTYGVPTAPGEWWEASAYLGAHRCWSRVRIEFLTSAGAFVADTAGNRVAGPLGGTEIGGYGFSWTKGQVPAGATRARLVIDGFNDNGADIGGGTPGTTPYIFFTKTLLGPSTPVTMAQGAQPQPWQPGGVTQIIGGMIKTGAVVARAISAGAIDATKLSVGSATNLIWNGCCGQSGAGWMAGVRASPAGDGYTLPGFGTGVFSLVSLAAGAYVDVSWAPNNGSDGSVYKYDGVNDTPWGAAVPCTPGVLMEAQVKVNTHRCSIELYLLFLGINANTNRIELLSAPSTGAQAFPAVGSGRALSSYTQMSVRGAVPTNATHCTLMMRVANTPAAQAVFGSGAGTSPFLFFTQAGLGTCLPNVPAPMPWAPGGMTTLDGGTLKTASILAGSLAVGSVTAGSIAAGAVTTGSLAANSVTAEKAAFGTSANLIWNSCPDQGAEGWLGFTFGAFMPTAASPDISMGVASLISPTFALAGLGSMFSGYTGTGLVNDQQGFAWDWRPAPTVGLPCTPGAPYGAAVSLVCGNKASATVRLLFFDAAQNVLAETASPGVYNNATAAAGTTEASYQRVSISAVAPANAATVLLRVLIIGYAGGTLNPYAAWTKVQLAQLPVGGKLGEWVAGGVTTIDGGMIKTGTLDATRIRAKSITAASIAAQTITGTEILAGSVNANRIAANSITSGQIAADAITTGMIQAGAVAADQIAANQMHAYHLAADFALIASAQIGLATIDTANIRNLIVTGDKVASNAVSSGASLVYNSGFRPPANGQWYGLSSCDFNSSGPSATHVFFFKSRNDYLPPTYDLGFSGSGADGGGGL